MESSDSIFIQPLSVDFPVCSCRPERSGQHDKTGIFSMAKIRVMFTYRSIHAEWTCSDRHGPSRKCHQTLNYGGLTRLSPTKRSDIYINDKSCFISVAEAE
jgi:hypothetical protein